MKLQHKTTQPLQRRVRAHDDPAITFVMWLYLAVLLMPLARLLWEFVG